MTRSTGLLLSCIVQIIWISFCLFFEGMKFCRNNFAFCFCDVDSDLVPCGMCPVCARGLVCQCADHGTDCTEECPSREVPQGKIEATIQSPWLQIYAIVLFICVIQMYRYYLERLRLNPEIICAKRHTSGLTPGPPTRPQWLSKYLSPI